MKIGKAFMTTSLFLCCIQAQAGKVLWKIGEPDRSCSEFALAPDKYGLYIEEGFGTERRPWIAGVSTDMDYPYILAGPKAGWAGYSYWAGWALSSQIIYFELENVDKSSSYSLNVNIIDAAGSSEISLRADVNSSLFRHVLNSGKRQLNFDIPGESLRNGVNRISLQLSGGEYVTFDNLSFEGSCRTKLKIPRKSLLLSVSDAGYSRIVNGRKVGTILLDVNNRGTAKDLQITIGGRHMTKRVDSGISCIELDAPFTRLNVEIRSEGETLLKSRIRPTEGPMMSTIDYVDQFAGSSGSRWMIGPGPWAPFGMVKIMPDNEDTRWKAGYEYQIENICGFSHIHEWTMCGLSTMAATGPLKTRKGGEDKPDEGYRSRIDKEKEKASIGYYSTYLSDYDINAEITATTRCSFQRYTFPESDLSRILIDLYPSFEYQWSLADAHIEKVSDREITGWSHNLCSSTGYHGQQDYTVYFVMQFDKPFRQMGGWAGDKVTEDISEHVKSSYNEPDDNFGAYVEFATQSHEAISIRTGISIVSLENARENLEKEISEPFGWDFERIVEAQRRKWEELFSVVEIKTDDRNLKRKFYTNLYRSITPRTIWNDVNGQWMDMDERIRQIEDENKDVYGSDAYWGMHWNLSPFYNILYPEYMSNWLYTFSQMYRIGGWLPIGNPGMEYFRVMVGSPAVPMIASAYQHGIRDFDSELLAEAIRHELTSNPEWYPGGGQVGNEDYPDYLRLGYVPYYNCPRPNPALHSYVSNTMEYAFQDYAAAQYFKALGMESDSETFLKRSENWKNIFDRESGFIHPRYPDGRQIESFNTFSSSGFCEGSAWQFTWYVPHDVKGLVELMGDRRFTDRLEWGMKQSEKFSFNALGDRMADFPINHGNETNMQSAYLFNFTDSPWLTQKWARAIQEEYYGLGPRDAYPGDEDQGQMSSWYVLNSIGLFEMDGGCSVEPMLEFGSPRFEEVTIRLSDRYYGGKILKIIARNVSKENCYIKSVKFNGKEIHVPRIAWSELKNGGILEFDMDSKANKTWWN